MIKEFNSKIQAQFAKMCKTGKLFRVKMSGQEVWDLYLSAFNEETDPVFRDPNSTTHNCNTCKNFIRRYGNIIAIDEHLNLMSIFDVSVTGEFADSAKALSKAIRASKIQDVFFETFDDLVSLPYQKCNRTTKVFQLGIDKNIKRYTREEAEKYGVVKPNEIREFHHMHLQLPARFVDKSGKSVEAIIAQYRDDAHVFGRAMKEISLSTLELVRDLINQGSLLDGTSHLFKIEAIIPLKKEYDSLSEAKRANWIWEKSYKFQFARFKNELIGVLCTELSQGEELNKACQSWNKRVDPRNYMKATAPITQKQIAEAQKFVEDNGYVESFNRRFAVLEDIRASEIQHMNSGSGSIKEVSLFDDVKATKHQHSRNKFDNIEEVSIETFMEKILPGCTSVEALLQNKHSGNMVTLTTAANAESKRIFKWDNNYSWTYNGNLAGKSQIKDAVKLAGGAVDGVLRFSIKWADGNDDNSDLDAHCIEPNGYEIYFGAKISRLTGGNLDIDIIDPNSYRRPGKPDIVENITYPSISKMSDGTYKFFVRQFSARNSRGFSAEIEFNGEIYSYEYNKPVRGDIYVAEVSLRNGEFSIKHRLPENTSSREIYGLESNQFHKVNLVCLSPNHWGNNQTGNKHYFFMLENCRTPTSIRSFHTENLNGDLLKHRKVMEVLGSTRMLEPTETQLSGLGFNSTVRDELILRLSGNFKRMLKVKF